MKTYKTLTVQLDRPGAGKAELLKQTMQNYTMCFRLLLERYRSDIENLARRGDLPAARVIAALPDRLTQNDLNRYAAQPFKDSLLMDFGYTVREALRCRRTDALFAPQTANGDMRPLYFGRYDPHRDYGLLYNRRTGRYYVKLYLLNRAGRIHAPALKTHETLVYIADGLPRADDLDGDRRYILAPLAFGKHQLADFEQVLREPRRLKTAALSYKKRRFYLSISLDCRSDKRITPETSLGVARSAAGIYYTVCRNGTRAAQGWLAWPWRDGPQVLPERHAAHRMANQLINLARQYASQIILESHGGAQDRLESILPPDQQGLPPHLYALMAVLLPYKLAAAGLPEPIPVSSRFLNTCCPACGNRNKKNLAIPDWLICVSCGQAVPRREAASYALANRLAYYRQTLVPVKVTYPDDHTVAFDNRLLGFRSVQQRGEQAADLMFRQLADWLAAQEHYETDKKKYGIICRLRLANSLPQAVRLVEPAFEQAAPSLTRRAPAGFVQPEQTRRAGGG
ncbi:MAG: hypothetical protein VB070_13400 [Clostridiaceae bacterium]|nr:hypothetical protein [Clostridiaceae bacterium]